MSGLNRFCGALSGATFGERVVDMKKALVGVVALLGVVVFAWSMAFAKDAARKKQPVDKDGRPVSTKSVAARTALCRADCSPKHYDPKTGIGIHGIYRAYRQFDPQLVSVEGRRQYADCVSRCLAPLPEVYVQRPLFAMGLSWFGKSKQSCLDCHVKGH
jgi:hypothetical protein